MYGTVTLKKQTNKRINMRYRFFVSTSKPCCLVSQKNKNAYVEESKKLEEKAFKSNPLCTSSTEKNLYYELGARYYSLVHCTNAYCAEVVFVIYSDKPIK